jgi:hypothetical protein
MKGMLCPETLAEVDLGRADVRSVFRIYQCWAPVAGCYVLEGKLQGRGDHSAVVRDGNIIARRQACQPQSGSRTTSKRSPMGFECGIGG